MAVRSPVPEAVRTSRALSRAVDGLRFDLPVTHVYNPLRYARASHEEYLRRFARPGCEALLLGMNPGPWGMAQTGVPFGEVAYVRDNSDLSGRLHHFALWVDNREDVLRAADIFMENGIFIEAGPSKHNNSQAFYLYSHEPGGNRVEVYNAGFMVFAPDFEPVIWDEDNRSGGVYWGQKLPDSFRSYATPVADESMVDADAPVIDPI